MPGTTVSDAPSVSLSFANNFWGKEDAGVSPLLERMHNAKVTSDELKAFYTARAQIEDDYARKLLNLARKPLGSSEAGTLRMSLDVVRQEVESMGKAHSNIAGQMKTELEEPLAAFAGGMKERRKIVQTGIEKLLKMKTQQTSAMNKAKDKYEQDCLKIKGYLAQGHMVMGQEERKNKAKLEKTQIQLSETSREYEQAVKVLEETTGRWNRDWKAACDKFQDLEEERIDFTKSSLWNFANIASTVCVTDDAACEKIRLSLEDCDVEKDIRLFIKESGTGQEIPDPPKFINFCRGDLNDNASEISDEGNYSVAQFPRAVNPAFRTSSPQPSVFESHNDPDSKLAQELRPHEPEPLPTQPPVQDPRQPSQPMPEQQRQQSQPHPAQQRRDSRAEQIQDPRADPRQDPRMQRQQMQQAQMQDMYGDVPQIPHNDYPMDGMTQFCRIGAPSDRSSQPSPARPSSRDSQSEYSNPTSFSSFEPSSGAHSPVKQMQQPIPSPISPSIEDEQSMQKRKGFFQGHSPFRRRSKHDIKEQQPPTSRNTWGPSAGRNMQPQIQEADQRQPRPFGQENRSNTFGARPSPSPEPVDPRANFQLNIGNNVFDVASPDARNRPSSKPGPPEELDPIAQALAELKGVTKGTSKRVSADRYHGLATPAPPGTPGVGSRTPAGAVSTPLAANSAVNAAQRGTPPPSYETQQPISRLGAPQPAFTSKQMQQTTQRYLDKNKTMFGSAPNTPSSRDNVSRPPISAGTGRPSFDGGRNSTSRPPTRGSSQGQQSQEIIRATSPIPPRAISPRPGLYQSNSNAPSPQPTHVQPVQQNPYARSASPNPYANPAPLNTQPRPRAQSSSPIKGSNPSPAPQQQQQNSWQSRSRQGSPSVMPQPLRATSPVPPQSFRPPTAGPGMNMNINERPTSSRGSDMALQLAPSGSSGGEGNSMPGGWGGSQFGTQRGRGMTNGPSNGGRPGSSYYGQPQGQGQGGMGGMGQENQVSTRVRSKSVAAGEARQVVLGDPNVAGDGRRYTKDGRPILQYSRAMYMYQAAIPEELSFAKGDILAVTRLQDDGWWEAEVVGKKGRPGLVPSNYLAPA